jgi:hypothetical protein
MHFNGLYPYGRFLPESGFYGSASGDSQGAEKPEGNVGIETPQERGLTDRQ